MHDACPLSELAPGEALRLDTAPPIAVFHTEEGEIFAIDDTCTHQDASLADAMWRNVGSGARFTHPGSTSVQEAWTNRRHNCRSGLTKSKSSMATSWSSNRTKPPTFRPD